ncbi:beta-propeller domain-containing protein [Nocardioides daejeonensis]|uniref:beta-propeller domain-containing protein n=1 Tax=Nocardioides daejeonensis TaxID=1046556 RepID=UPI0013A59D34|nr:beta-propeller domain-containing protein [Nocardioides daejeonensis]
MSRSSQAPFAAAALSVLALVGGLTAAVALHEPAPTGGTAASSSGPAGAPALSVAAVPGRLTSAASCEDLLARLHAAGSELVGPWGWGYGPVYAYDGVQLLRGALAAATPRDLDTASRLTEQSNSETGTNVQEAGVDEPDVAKTNGTILVRVDRHRLTTYDVTGDRVRRLGTLKLPARTSEPELLLRGERALVVDHNWWRGGATSRVTGIDLADPRAPEVADVHEFDGELLSARLTGDDVRLVTSTALPDLPFVHPTRSRSRKEARRANREIVRESTIEDWLPQVRDDGTTSPLLDCAAVELPEDGGLGTLSIIGFPIGDPADRDATAVLTDSRIVYSSTDRLYLATGMSWGRCCILFDTAARLGGGTGDTTDLHAFALSGTQATYQGSGQLKGTVRDRWALDSADGVLRVALAIPEKRQKGKPTAMAQNAVVTMAERDGRLEETGRVDGLGVNEEIQSVRWFDDFAVVVTFRQIDPLYAIDLSTDRPRLLGELKIPGFSSYLHPIGDDRLLGIGTDADQRGRSLGPQASTFDISDPAALAQLSKVTYGRNAELPAAWEPRQFTWLPDANVALTPVMRYGGRDRFALSVLQVGADGKLTEERVTLAGGWRTYNNLRTVPLPDGRVVLSSAKENRFLSW